MADIKTIAETPVNLTAEGVGELKKLLGEEYGIEPAAAAVAVAGPTAGAVAEAEEKNSFDVVPKSFGSAKLAIVKTVKEHTGLGLKGAKELTDAAPTNIKEDVDKTTAEILKAALEETGVKVGLR